MHLDIIIEICTISQFLLPAFLHAQSKKTTCTGTGWNISIKEKLGAGFRDNAVMVGCDRRLLYWEKPAGPCCFMTYGVFGPVPVCLSVSVHQPASLFIFLCVHMCAGHAWLCSCLLAIVHAIVHSRLTLSFSVYECVPLGFQSKPLWPCASHQTLCLGAWL